MSTLPANTYYRVGDKYFDTVANAMYRCITAGTNATSVWVKVGGTGGGNINMRGLYVPETTYALYDAVILGSGPATGVYWSTMDGNDNAPDSGIGWLQISTVQGQCL